MGTKAQILSGEEPCVNNAHTNEPLFVLRGTDPLAEELVRDWARQYYASKVADRVPPRNAGKDELLAFEQEQSRRAEKHSSALVIANQMRKYRTTYEQATGTEEERIGKAAASIAAEPPAT